MARSKVRSWAPTLALALVSAVVAAPNRAFAYRTAAESPELAPFGQSLVTWRPGPIYIEAVVDDQYATAAAYVLDDFVRSLAAVRCAQVDVQLVAPAGGVSSLGDGRTTIRFARADWETDLHLAPERMASTELRYQERPDGGFDIVEADIVINASNYRYAYGITSGSSDVRELGAVLIHELGHVLGLLHPCELDGTTGAPLCSSDASFAVRTMYPEYTGPDQASWDADDIAGLCHQFPASVCLEACAAGYECVGGTCAAVCGNEVCEPGSACTAQGCRAQCGGALCAVGDRCVDERCLAFCFVGGLCGVGQFCSSAGCELKSCVTDPETCGYEARSCDTHTPCPAGMECSSNVCLTLPGEGRCSVDDVCTDGARCLSGLCSYAWAAEGEPCSSDAACTTGYCVEGLCRWPCEGGCPGGYSCAPSLADGRSFCEPSLADFGQPCQLGAQCSSRACLLRGSDGAGYCTRHCTAARDTCPAGYSCASVGSVAVCEPGVVLMRYGCQVGLPPRASSGGSWLFASLGLAWFVRLRRRAVCALERNR